MLGAISLGILQLIAIKYTNSIWCYFDAFLRTTFSRASLRESGQTRDPLPDRLIPPTHGTGMSEIVEAPQVRRLHRKALRSGSTMVQCTQIGGKQTRQAQA